MINTTSKPIIPTDKTLHFAANVIIVLFIFGILRGIFGILTLGSALIGMVAATAISIIKEYIDKMDGGEFSLADLWADYAGIVTAGGCCIALMGLGV